MIKLGQKLILNILVTSVIGVFFGSCENDIDEVNRVTTHVELPVQTIIQSKITYTDSTRVEFTVEAGKIDRHPSEEDPRDEFSNGVEVITYSKSGAFESQINAENATNYLNRKIMIARDSVVLKNFEGKTLKTELLTWDDEAKRIYTDEFVEIITPNEILFGDGLEAKSDFSEYEIQNIKGRIKVDSEEPQQETEHTQ